MKNLIFALILFSLFIHQLHAQEYKLVIKENIAAQNNSNSNYLLDHQGVIVGSYQGFIRQDEPPEMKVTYKGSTLQIPDPLGMFITVPNANRLFNYGSTPGFVIDYNLKLKIFNLSGVLINTYDDVGHGPYTVAASSDGNFYMASLVDDNNKKESELYLKKIDQKGILNWNINLGKRRPLNIYISPDNNTIAMVLNNQFNETMDVKFFNSNGKLITSYDNLYSVSGLEFISKNKFILVDHTGWQICELKDKVKVIYSGKLPGNTFSNYPITVNNKSGWLIIVSLSPGNYYHLEMINISNGKTITSLEVKDTPYWEPYRLLFYDDKNNLMLRTENSSIRLEIIH